MSILVISLYIVVLRCFRRLALTYSDHFNHWQGQFVGCVY